MKEKAEPCLIQNPEEIIFGVNQNDVLTNPDNVKGVDEKGFFVEPKKVSEEKRVSQYWFHERKKIALIGFVSASILFVLLAGQTDIISKIFDTVFEIISNFVSPFIPKLPKVF